MKIKIFKLDSFTNERFKGNPAAVCILEHWIDDEIMQNIAKENNLAETAFVVKNKDIFEIRWFTPLVEVDLCGHATLATAYVLFQFYNEKNNPIKFYSFRSGELNVAQNANEMLTLDFPVDKFETCQIPKELDTAFNFKAKECYRGKTDYLLIFNSQNEIVNINPNLSEIKKMDGRGVIVSAPGKDVDFVSRFFAPQSGIDEDPVTGSAHTTLTPYWANKLNKTKLKATQLSERKGYLECTLLGNRVLIGGHVVVFLEGEIII